MSENPTPWQPTEYIEGEPMVPLRGSPPAQTRQAAAERRQKAARDGRDTDLPTAPNTGLVQR